MKNSEEPKSGGAEFKLYDTGCRLCGAPTNFQLGHDSATRAPLLKTSRANVGSYLCSECGGREDKCRSADAEITRRLSLRHEPAEQKTWEPSVGEMCDGAIVDWATSDVRGEILRGAFVEHQPSGSVLRVDGHLRSVATASLRPIPASTPPARAPTSPEIPDNSPKPSEPVRGDPYLAHREKLSRQFYGVEGANTCLVTALKQADKDAERLSKMTLRERRKSEALRMLDRPLPVRTGPLLNRDRYGQRVALHGWSEDAEYEGQV